MSARRCVVCNKSIARVAHCTNSCCLMCHDRFCSLGGNDSPGHGINVAQARAELARVYESARVKGPA